MRIDATKCLGCLECLDFCPMDCMLDEGGFARIDEDEYVECGVCLRAGVCPNDAIFMDVELETNNPVYLLLADPKTGQMKPEVRHEKVLSAILEFKFRTHRCRAILDACRDAGTTAVTP